MDMAKMMQLFSHQRHDFLNHLQVVSGLLQMNREEQARDYIKNVAREVALLSKIVHLKIPEAAAAILLSHYAAAELGVGMEFEINANLGNCLIPGSVLGSALEAVLGHLTEYLAPPDNKERIIHVGVYAAANGYRITARHRQNQGDNVPGNDGTLPDVAGELARYGGGLENSTQCEYREIAVFLPAAEA